MRNPLEGDYTFDPPVVLLAALEKNLIKDTREVLGTVFNQAPTTCEWGPRFEESFSKINPTGEFTKNGEVWRWVLPNPISPEQREPGKISITPQRCPLSESFLFLPLLPTS